MSSPRANLKRRTVRLAGVLAAAAAMTVGLAACNQDKIELTKGDPNYAGAVLFNQRCSGCHTLAAAGAEGSSTNVRDTERTDGPNLDSRKETVESTLFAIRNGGFSGQIMPENIATGEEAQQIAHFVAKYAGSDAK